MACSAGGGRIFDLLVGVVCVVGVIVLLYRRLPVSAATAASWPETEGTIRSVHRVVVNAGRSSYFLDIGDFSYKVNDEFYSGQATISRGFSVGDDSSKELVDRKVRVLYDPQKPETFSFPQQQVGGFVVNPYAALNATDVDPIDLNIA